MTLIYKLKAGSEEKNVVRTAKEKTKIFMYFPPDLHNQRHMWYLVHDNLRFLETSRKRCFAFYSFSADASLH